MGRKRGQLNNQLIDEVVAFEKELAKAYSAALMDKSEDKYMSLGELIETSPERKVSFKILRHLKINLLIIKFLHFRFHGNSC